jgi:mono/diheme cytochrome c family protein
MPTRSTRSGSSGGGFGSFLAGALTALLLLGAGLYLYLRFGHPPVAVADAPFPFERQVVGVPLEARIARERKQPPFGTSEDVFEAGAKVYAANCSGCHGSPGHDAAFGKDIYPQAPQLWKKHAHGGVVGVSDDEPGETFWKIENGIRLSGMPSYRHTLSETQMWQVSLLLKNADQQLPDPVLRLLQEPEMVPETKR